MQQGAKRGLYGHQALKDMRDKAADALRKKSVSVDVINHNQELFYELAASLRGLTTGHANVNPQNLLLLALYHENLRSSSVLPPEVRPHIGGLFEEFVRLKKFDMSEKRVWTPYSELVDSNPALALFRTIDLAHMPFDKKILVKSFQFEEKNLDLQLQNIAKSMLYVYVPFADILGLSNVLSKLKDTAVRHLYPDLYNEVARKLLETQNYYQGVKGMFAEQLKNDINEASALYGIEFAKFADSESLYRCRIKSPAAIVLKLLNGNMPIEKMFSIHDIVAFTVLTKSVEEAYLFLEFMTDKYIISPENIDDFIAHPRGETKYQSLHADVPCTALASSPFAEEVSNKNVEVQMRTPEMQKQYESGDWAHALYKGNRLEKAKLLMVTQYAGILRNSSTEDVQMMALSMRSGRISVKVTFNGAISVIDLPKNACTFDLICKLSDNPFKKHNVYSATTHKQFALLELLFADGDYIIEQTGEDIKINTITKNLSVYTVETRMRIEEHLKELKAKKK